MKTANRRGKVQNFHDKIMDLSRSGSTLILNLLAFLCLSGTVVLGESFTVYQNRKCKVQKGKTSKVGRIIDCENKCLADTSCKGYETVWIKKTNKYKCKLLFTTPTEGKKKEVNLCCKSTRQSRVIIKPK